MSPTPCVPACCSTPTTTNLPGLTGASAVTITTASLVLPAIGSTVSIALGDASWLKAGKNVFVSDGSRLGNFIVLSVDSVTAITARFLGLVGDSASGTVGSGALVIPGVGNLTAAWDLDALTAFTDNSGGAKSDTIAASLVKSTIIIGPFSMALLINSQIWRIPVPFAFAVNSAAFRDDVAITTGAKAATLTTQIGGVATTGGIISVSGTYATGATQAGTSISGTNIGTAGQNLEILISGVTTFIEGYGHVELNVTNLDLAATIAALSFKANQLRTVLRHQ